MFGFFNGFNNTLMYKLCHLRTSSQDKNLPYIGDNPQY